MSAADGVRKYAEDRKGRVQKAMDEVALRILNAAKDHLTKEGKVDTGELRASGTVAHVDEFLWRVAFTAKHAAFVHYGTRPHWPPLQPIVEWVRRNATKLSSGEVTIRAAPGTPQRNASEAEIQRIARAIQVKISREGTEPVPFLAQAVEDVRPQVAGILAKHVGGGQ